MRAILHPILCLVPTSALLLNTGCVSSKYKMAEYERQAVPMNLVAAPPAEIAPGPALAVEAMVNTVIALQGPGSWKRRAYWDEYVVTLTNRTPAPLVIESVTLTDFQGQTVSPGTEPWVLEKQSRDYESRILGTAGDVLKIGGGVVLAGGTGVAAGGLAAWVTGAAGWTAMGVVGTTMLAAVPVYAVGTVYRNVSSRHKVEEEFTRRSLSLPLTLPPGKIVQGSFFFRISPGPRQLALSTSASDGPRNDIVIGLAPLAGLHLKRGPELASAGSPVAVMR